MDPDPDPRGPKTYGPATLTKIAAHEIKKKMIRSSRWNNTMSAYCLLSHNCGSFLQGFICSVPHRRASLAPPTSKPCWTVLSTFLFCSPQPTIQVENMRNGTASVADPDPGSGAFLTPGSGIRNRFFRIPDPKTIFLRAFWQFFGKSSIIVCKLAQIFFFSTSKLK